MQRTYLSGAQKRKLAAEKEAKKRDALTKTAKINQFFNVIPSTTTSATSSNTENIEVDKAESSDCEVDLASHDHEDETIELVNIDANIANVSASSSHEDEFRSESMHFSTDVGLWNVDTDISSLQNYWIDKGRKDQRYAIFSWKMEGMIHVIICLS